MTPSSFRYCVHNNLHDPNYLARPVAGDTVDGDGVVTIESYGVGADGARSHLTVEVSAGRASQTPISDYFQAGGDGRKLAAGEPVSVTARAVSF